MDNTSARQWAQALKDAPLKAYALGYARKRWKVLPLWWVKKPEYIDPKTGEVFDAVCACGQSKCSAPGKHPITHDGLKSATDNYDIIKEWWTKHPFANIGVLTGGPSGIVALDVEREGLGHMVNLTKQFGNLEPTPLTETGGGGRHVIWKHPGKPVGNRTRLIPHVDVRGDGGYIVAPPSLHETGSAYRWLNMVGKVPIAPIPFWFWRLEDAQKKQAKRKRKRREDMKPDLDTITERIGDMPEGGRNDGLFRLAKRLYHDGHSYAEVEEVIHRANREKCKPPLYEKEVNKLIGSAMEARR